MKKFQASIFLWSSPLFCCDPERSKFEYLLLKPDLNNKKIIYAFIFLLRSIFSGLKKIKNRKIFATKFVNNGFNENILYSPSSFINIQDSTCKYFPSVDAKTSFLIIDSEKKLSNNSLKIIKNLFFHILPEFNKLNKNKNLLEKSINWFIFLSYFFSLEALSNYFLACDVYDLSIAYPKAKHICLHEMHPYSRIVYGVLTITNSISITLQHALIHPTRLMFDLRKNDVKTYLPDKIFVWSKESKNTLNYFGWPNEIIKFCSSERFLMLNKVFLNKKYFLTKKYITTSNEKSLIFIPSLLKDDFKLSYKSALHIRSKNKNIKIFIKLHPSYNLSLKEYFISLFLSSKSIFFTNENINEIFKRKPLILSYSSTAIYEAALYGCHSFYIPTGLEYSGNELILKKVLLSIIEKYKKNEILEESKDPLYISAERSKSFFGLEREKFFTMISK